MALVKDVTLWFNPAVGHDTPEVSGYKLYITPESSPMSRAIDGTVPNSTEFSLGKPNPDPDGKLRVNLATLPGMTSLDGNYNLGIATVDDVGNESSLFAINSVPLDFTVPEPVTDAGIERA